MNRQPSVAVSEVTQTVRGKMSYNTLTKKRMEQQEKNKDAPKEKAIIHYKGKRLYCTDLQYMFSTDFQDN